MSAVPREQTPFRDASDHLRDELARVDKLVRAATLQWRESLGATKSNRHWGMAYVSGLEVDGYLGAPFALEEEIPRSVRDRVLALRAEAERDRREIDARLVSAAAAVASPLAQLAERFSLDEVALDVLLLCVLAERDARYRRLFAYLQDDATRTRPSVELLQRVLGAGGAPAESWYRTLGAAGPLLGPRLVTLSGDGNAGVPFLLRAVQIEDRVAGFILGSQVPDERIAPFVTISSRPGQWNSRLAAPVTLDALREAAARCNARMNSSRLTVLLEGEPGSGRGSAAMSLAHASGLRLLTIDTEAAIADAGVWSMRIELLLREARLQGAALFWDRADRLSEDEALAPAWKTLLRACEKFEGLAIIASSPCARWPLDAQGDAPAIVRFPMPGYEMRKRHWETLLPAGAFSDEGGERSQLCERLASTFQLTFGQARRALVSAVTAAQRSAEGLPALDGAELVSACRGQAGVRLTGLARRIEPSGKLTLDDLVLPPASRKHVLELRDRVLYHRELLHRTGLDGRLSYGDGLVALFTGPPGTGKTMTAELLAREAGVDLYKVDLASIVSRYVGDTEKNLRRLFDEAEHTNALVMIDEGESLLGRRGAITNGQDRWAGQEVAYLLQRLESYAGVVIFSTNLRQNIDDAFFRRIHCIIEYPFPDEASRFEIWRRLVPSSFSAIADAELQQLARQFPLAGGSIRNVVIDAAYRAYASHAPGIELKHAVVAIAREYQKGARPLSRAEFGAQFYDWIHAEIIEPST